MKLFKSVNVPLLVVLIVIIIIVLCLSRNNIEEGFYGGDDFDWFGEIMRALREGRKKK